MAVHTFRLHSTGSSVLAALPEPERASRIARLREILSSVRDTRLFRTVVGLYGAYQLVNEGTLPGYLGRVQIGQEYLDDLLNESLGVRGPRLVPSRERVPHAINWLRGTEPHVDVDELAGIIVELYPQWYRDP